MISRTCRQTAPLIIQKVRYSCNIEPSLAAWQCKLQGMLGEGESHSSHAHVHSYAGSMQDSVAQPPSLHYDQTTCVWNSCAVWMRHGLSAAAALVAVLRTGTPSCGRAPAQMCPHAEQPRCPAGKGPSPQPTCTGDSQEGLCDIMRYGSSQSEASLCPIPTHCCQLQGLGQLLWGPCIAVYAPGGHLWDACCIC